jgi:hypothetical protein
MRKPFAKRTGESFLWKSIAHPRIASSSKQKEFPAGLIDRMQQTNVLDLLFTFV